jgi:hypothetical protein
MRQITTAITATALLLTGLLIGSVLPTSAQSKELASAKVVPLIESDTTDEQRALIDWATRRFAMAGLTPPSVEFVFHSSSLDCSGHIGLYYANSDTIHLCRLDNSAILHEMAHAWARQNLATATIAQFVSSRDLAAWNDQDEPWSLRGTEHAAEIIAWALLDHNRLVRWIANDGDETYKLLSIPDSSSDRLSDGFELLTGMQATARLLDNPNTAAPASTFRRDSWMH